MRNWIRRHLFVPFLTSAYITGVGLGMVIFNQRSLNPLDAVMFVFCLWVDHHTRRIY